MTNPTLPTAKGTYVLLFHCTEEHICQLGRLGKHEITVGDYLYIGSAFGPGGLAARLKHHIQPSPKPHWHIDYLKAQLCLKEIWYSSDPQRREDEWVKVMAERRGARCPIPGFGASDSRSLSHLFHFNRAPSWRTFSRHLHRQIPAQKRLHCYRAAARDHSAE